jgi:hypothetical protein
MADMDLPREPWAVDVTLMSRQFFEQADGAPVNAELPLLAASWVQTSSGWQLGGLLKSRADLSRVENVNVRYPDHSVETLTISEPPARHARTGDPRGVFTTFHIVGEPTWPGAVAQHEAMLQEMREEGFVFEGDDKDGN